MDDKMGKHNIPFFLIGGIVYFFLCRQDNILRFNIQRDKQCEKKCLAIICFLEKKNTELDIQRLWLEKQDIFGKGLRKRFFFYSAHQLYGHQKSISFFTKLTLLRKINIDYLQ